MKITSKEWYFWRWVLKWWPFARGWQWLEHRRQNAFRKWKKKEGLPL